MRLALLLCLVFSSIANADDATLVWSIPGQISPKAKSIYPIAQEPFLATDNRLIVCFPPDYVLGTNPQNGKRVWIWPFTPSDARLQDSRSLRNAGQAWGPRSVTISVDPVRKQVLSLDRDGAIAALDWSRDGYLTWYAGGDRSEDATLSNHVAMGSPCIDADSAFYLAHFKSSLVLVKIDLATGKSISQTELAEFEEPVRKHCNYGPIKCGDLLVCPLPTDELVALRLDSLKEKWRIRIAGLSASIFRLVSSDSRVVVMSDNAARPCLLSPAEPYGLADP